MHVPWTRTRTATFVLKKLLAIFYNFLAYSRKLGNHRSSEGLQNFKPSKGTNLLTLIILAGEIEMNPGPRFLCRLCKKYCKATDKFVTCNDCEKRFHATCANSSEKELSSLKNENEPWYCSDCKADCGLCSGAVLNSHKAVQCDKCELWVHNKCSLVSDNQTMKIYKIQIVHGFAQNVTSSTFRIHFFLIN